MPELNPLDTELLEPIGLIADDLGQHLLGLAPAPKNSITCSISELTTPQSTIAA